jgi:hypothetical protein
LIGMIDSQQGRQKVKRFLVQGVCDKYQGASHCSRKHPALLFLLIRA